MSSLFGKRSVVVWVLLLVLSTLVWYLTRPEPITVKAQAIGYGLVKATVSNTRVGTVKACRRAYLAPQAGGQIAKLTVKEGSLVEKNQLLLEVWNQDLQSRVALEQAQKSTILARTKEACALAKGARREAKRLERLWAFNQIVSEESVDTALTEAEAKEASCKAAKAAVFVNNAQIKVAQAAVERTLLYAPFDGVVAEINAELGEYVTPSPPGIPTLPAIDLLDVSCLYVSAPIDEVDAPAIQTGMKAAVNLDAFPQRSFSGFVRRIAPYVQEKEKQARTVEVEVEISAKEETEGLLPGYSADIEVMLETRSNVLRIPTEAVFEGNRVLIVGEDDHLVEREFTAGLSNWGFTEVISGLVKDDRIVVSIGRDGVEAGAYVVIQSTSKE